MSSDVLGQLSSPSAAAALIVAGLGAVYAFAQLGAWSEGAGVGAERGGGEGGSSGDGVTVSESKATKAKTRQRKKGKKDTTGAGDAEKASKTGVGAVVVPFPTVIPGDFEVTPAAGTHTDVSSNLPAPSHDVSPAREAEAGVAKRRKKKQNKAKMIRQGVGKEEGEGEEGKVAEGADPEDKIGPRSPGDTTADASVSVSAITPASSSLALRNGTGNGSIRASVTPAPSSQSSISRGRGPSPSFDTDSSWTHIQPRHGKTVKTDSTGAQTLGISTDVTSSDAASTASNSPVTDMRGPRGPHDQRTLAEKLVPKPNKTGVDDMLEVSDVPTLARVMRVQPRADETPVPGFSWEDYGDVIEDSGHLNDADEEDEGGWGVVMGRNRQKTSRTTSTSVSAPAQPVTSSSQTMTKKQRQNAKKRELAKVAKADAEAARLDGLAKHKRELERLRIIEQSQQGGGKRPSGGMHATVDDRGKLVWE